MINNRLLFCANYVRPNVSVVDVGTDHALLPCYLVKSGITQKVIAADINKAPLLRAADTINKFNLSDKISTVLSDGLNEITAESADDIVIAGMGGELISQIVLNCTWLHDSAKHLILQPMKRESYLRKSLYKHGFEILSETAVFENNHHYTVMLCVYTGVCVCVDDVFAMIGKMKVQETFDGKTAAKNYIEFQIKRAKKIAAGLRRAENQTEESLQKACKYDEIAEIISALIS